MTVDEKLSEAVNLLKEAANPERIILFGSRARGDIHEESDFDIMVIEKEVKSKNKEIVRLLRVISRTLVNVDLIVVSEEQFNQWKHNLNSVYNKASKEGRILYDKAA